MISGGGKGWLIRLNLLDIRSEIRRLSLNSLPKTLSSLLYGMIVL